MYQIELDYEGNAYSIEAEVAEHGYAVDHAPCFDDPGGLEIMGEPTFTCDVFVWTDDGWEPEDNPDEALLNKAEEVLQEIYWDRYVYTGGFE